MGRGSISGRILALLLGWCSELKNLSSKQGLCITSFLVPRDFKYSRCNFYLLWATTCVLVIKSVIWSNLGHRSNHLSYFVANNEIMWFWIKAKTLVVVRHANFHFHLVHSCENWSKDNSSFESTLHMWLFWFKVKRI